MNSVSTSLIHLSSAAKAINSYLEKYGSRLAPKNLKSLKDIAQIVKILEKYLTSKSIKKSEELKGEEECVTIEVMDLLIETELYKTDFLKLYEFFDRSDLVRKINGFIQS
jgi:DUF438 domain-containing protein